MSDPLERAEEYKQEAYSLYPDMQDRWGEYPYYSDGNFNPDFVDEVENRKKSRKYNLERIAISLQDRPEYLRNYSEQDIQLVHGNPELRGLPMVPMTEDTFRGTLASLKQAGAPAAPEEPYQAFASLSQKNRLSPFYGGQQDFDERPFGFESYVGRPETQAPEGFDWGESLDTIQTGVAQLSPVQFGEDTRDSRATHAIHDKWDIPDVRIATPPSYWQENVPNIWEGFLEAEERYSEPVYSAVMAHADMPTRKRYQELLARGHKGGPGTWQAAYQQSKAAGEVNPYMDLAVQMFADPLAILPVFKALKLVKMGMKIAPEGIKGAPGAVSGFIDFLKRTDTGPQPTRLADEKVGRFGLPTGNVPGPLRKDLIPEHEVQNVRVGRRFAEIEDVSKQAVSQAEEKAIALADTGSWAVDPKARAQQLLDAIKNTPEKTFEEAVDIAAKDLFEVVSRGRGDWIVRYQAKGTYEDVEDIWRQLGSTASRGIGTKAKAWNTAREYGIKGALKQKGFATDFRSSSHEPELVREALIRTGKFGLPTATRTTPSSLVDPAISKQVDQLLSGEISPSAKAVTARTRKQVGIVFERLIMGQRKNKKGEWLDLTEAEKTRDIEYLAKRTGQKSGAIEALVKNARSSLEEAAGMGYNPRLDPTRPLDVTRGSGDEALTTFGTDISPGDIGQTQMAKNIFESESNLGEILRNATRDEAGSLYKTQTRLYEGKLNAALSEINNTQRDLRQKLVATGLGGERRGEFVPTKEGVEKLTVAYKYLHGEITDINAVDESLRPLIDDWQKLRDLEETEFILKNDINDPSELTVKDYFYRGWKPSSDEKHWFIKLTGIKKVGDFQESPTQSALAKPGFEKKRTDYSFEDYIDKGYEPLSWDPGTQAAFRSQMRIKNQHANLFLLSIKRFAGNDNLDKKGLGYVWRLGDHVNPETGKKYESIDQIKLPDGSSAANSYRIPRIGPSFEGKTYVDNAGQMRKTQPYYVSNEIADILEGVFGTTPELNFRLPLTSATYDWRPLISRAVFFTKRAKLLGSFFQVRDFIQRGIAGAFSASYDDAQKAIINLSEGNVNAARSNLFNSGKHVIHTPVTIKDVVHSYWSPSARRKLDDWYVSKDPIAGSNITPLMLTQAGLSKFDPTILPLLEPQSYNVPTSVVDDLSTAGAFKQKTGQTLEQARQKALDIEYALREGLFEGVYPAAIKNDIENNILPTVIRAFPRATDEQIAAYVVKAANTRYSVLPASQSVLINQPTLRHILMHSFFSVGENEGLIRQYTGMFRGPMKSFWLKDKIGTYLSMAFMANTIHFVSTGKPLPIDRLNPLQLREDFQHDPIAGYLPIAKGLTYNRDFMEPQISGFFSESPLKVNLPEFMGGEFTLGGIKVGGLGMTKLFTEVLGQQDTVLKMFDPLAWVNARFSAPVQAIMEQLQGKTFHDVDLEGGTPMQNLTARSFAGVTSLLAPIGPGTSLIEMGRQELDPESQYTRPLGDQAIGPTGQLIEAATLGTVGVTAESSHDIEQRLVQQYIDERPEEADMMGLRGKEFDQIALPDQNKILSLDTNLPLVDELTRRKEWMGRKKVEVGSKAAFFKKDQEIEDARFVESKKIDELNLSSLELNDKYLELYKDTIQRRQDHWESAFESGLMERERERESPDDWMDQFIYGLGSGEDIDEVYQLFTGMTIAEDRNYSPREFSKEEAAGPDGGIKGEWKPSEMNRRIRIIDNKFGEGTYLKLKFARIERDEREGTITSGMAEWMRDKYILDYYYRPVTYQVGLQLLDSQPEGVKIAWSNYIDSSEATRRRLDDTGKFSSSQRVYQVGIHKWTFRDILESSEMDEARRAIRGYRLMDPSGRDVTIDDLLSKWRGLTPLDEQGYFRSGNPEIKYQYGY